MFIFPKIVLTARISKKIIELIGLIFLFGFFLPKLPAQAQDLTINLDPADSHWVGINDPDGVATDTGAWWENNAIVSETRATIDIRIPEILGMAGAKARIRWSSNDWHHIGLYKSNDGGATFVPIWTRGMHFTFDEIHDIDLDPACEYYRISFADGNLAWEITSVYKSVGIFFSCGYSSCDGANLLPCSCGAAITDAANPWCCAAFNTVHPDKTTCCNAGCGDLDLDGDNSIECLGGDCDDNDPLISSLIIEDEAAGNCDDGKDNDCDGFTDRCHDPDCDCAGGIIPCGRHTDDPTTAVLENAPCTICHTFLIIKQVIDLLLLYILLPLATLGFIVSGVLFLSSAGDPGQVGQAKTALKITGLGVFLAFTSWILMELFVAAIVPSSKPWSDWKTLSCPVAPCDSDGLCETSLFIVGSDNEDEDSQNCPNDCRCDFNGDCSPLETIAGFPQACPDCAICGDGIVDVGEKCDPGGGYRGGINPIGGCATFGYASGDLSCTDDCEIDLSACSR